MNTDILFAFIGLFGEDKPDRRERLRAMLSSMDDDDVLRILHRVEIEAPQQHRDESTWYHEGPRALRQARIYIANYSLPRSAIYYHITLIYFRAKLRLEKAREDVKEAPQKKALRMQERHKWILGLSIYGSQVGDVRPLSFCEFAPDSAHLVTAGWFVMYIFGTMFRFLRSGLCKLWSIPDCRLERTYRGHNAQAGCARFHPQAFKTMNPTLLNIASCAHDGSVLLWNLEK